ncbi:hypothetical protein NQ315_006226 [Exocentrus adspersus]|uniref:Peptidase C1A papain C-terminal domain-containing protein n=1 Tax=Exocentrus adspersus TaxID=1586481 RepID=A0AAV8VZN0_9CUCU|nr:hypothetical protein NQ315_006226 [Exocentrus adspersus]
MKYLLLLATAALSASAIPNLKKFLDPDELIDMVNNKRSTWTAGTNFDADSLPKLQFTGVLKNPNRTLLVKEHKTGRNLIPDFFDARDYWPECSKISEIRDQASCGSCWAFGAVEAMSDRICIHSNATKQVSVSAEDLMSCCGLTCGLGCYGGFPDSAWDYWLKSGIVTGGLYGTNDGCKPYSIAPCAHFNKFSSEPACDTEVITPMCVSTCDVPTLTYNNELTFGETVYYIHSDQDQIKMEIMINGPVEAAFNVYEDFLYYKSGVYQNVGGELLGGHAVKLLGWGVYNGTDYWLVANSYGVEWGDNGYFKILRGVNHVGIESDVVAGLPKL